MADAWGWPIQRLDASATVYARLRGVGVLGAQRGIPRWLLCRQWHKLERSNLFKDAQPYSYKQNDGMLVFVPFTCHHTGKGVGNTLKRHYETYLLEYELAHDDIDGECCLICHSLCIYSGALGDWVNCGLCGEWAHLGCDRRKGLSTFKDYSKADGMEYICPQCSLAKYKPPLPAP
ncbi:AT-rich interactive domain-containing protein 4 [Zea mays]|uniref:AT-rich interactive domain-containing protein 4 n=1 Tax=Zea mays TaxID=4577 RepID=A0A1D6KNI9_MAIZE|nr:AT-rich interactive domain-containing protein 4 [Zea mays]